MNLALLFEPLHGPWLPEAAPVGTLAARLAAFRAGHAFPTEWASADIALLGVADSSPDLPGVEAAGPDAIRARFYHLTAGTGAWRLVDLGNLRPGPTPDDTAHRLAEVVELLLRHRVLPIILGADHALTLGQHAGYEFRPPHSSQPTEPPTVRGAIIDRAFDVADEGAPAHTWLRELLLREPNHLATLSHLGHQRYHVTAAESAALEKMYFDLLRLGHLHTSLREAEPLLRAADWLSVDVSACAHAAIPAPDAAASPFGLSAEQLSQLTWYAGRSRQLSSSGFYGYNVAADPHGVGAMTLAVAAWYLVEGYYHRPAHGPSDAGGAYSSYTVSLANSTEESLTFYHHPPTDQWWLLVEPPAAPAHLLPCSEADYHLATQGEIPHRWVQALARA